MNAKALVQVPVLSVRLKESFLGVGALVGEVRIGPEDSRQEWEDPNPVAVVAFIEGVLKYRLVPGFVGSGLYFRREARFVDA